MMDLWWCLALIGSALWCISAYAFYRFVKVKHADDLVRAQESAAHLEALNLIYHKINGNVEQHCYTEHRMKHINQELRKSIYNRGLQYRLLFNLFKF